MNKNDKIYIAGHKGLVGSAIARLLKKEGYNNLLYRSHSELDLADQSAVKDFFRQESPDYVFLAAAKVGGVHANNSNPADFIRDNLLIQTNVIDAAYKYSAKKLAFISSSCIYPRLAPQPMKEEYLLTGKLEPTTEWYAIAKVAGIKMCQAYRRQYGFDAISLVPSNLYGPGDNFNLENSNVLPMLLRKFHDAKTKGESCVTVWGTGSPRRELMHVDDLADAAVFLMQSYDDEEIINVGTGKDNTIIELVDMIKEITAFEGEIYFDTTKPDGIPRKLLDISRINNFGWMPKISLIEGIKSTYQWLLENIDSIRI